jgi:hypothetical protein
MAFVERAGFFVSVAGVAAGSFPGALTGEPCFASAESTIDLN